MVIESTPNEIVPVQKAMTAGYFYNTVSRVQFSKWDNADKVDVGSYR